MLAVRRRTGTLLDGDWTDPVAGERQVPAQTLVSGSRALDRTRSYAAAAPQRTSLRTNRTDHRC